MEMQIEQTVEWYRDQVIFLTGGTGTLGGCLVHKLAVQLPTAKIFVLCRGSVRQAIEKWEVSMPMQVDDILDTGKIQFVVGDMNRDPDLGLKASDLQQLRDQVTVVINAAADISPHKQLPETVQTNCVSYLKLMTVLAGFSRLRSFLHVSTTYVNSFLPDGRIEERIYRLGEGDHNGYDYDDPERELSSILSTGSSAHTHRFASPYALAKYLAERLMLDRAANAPAVSMLIVRPSLIGPAIRDPYPGYGAEGTIPIHTFLQTLLGSPEYGPFRLAKELPQQQVLDEIPVDLVANTCLAHLVLGTTGIVHAAVQLYVERTVEESIDRCHRYTPPAVMEKMRQTNLARGQNLAPDFFRIVQQTFGDWTQDCGRSQHLKHLAGPVGLSLEGHDPEAFLKLRISQMSRVLNERLRVG